MSGQQHCINCLRESQGFYPYPCQQCGWSPDQHGESGLYLSPGTLLHDQYQIARMLGHGGFGITYLAWDTLLETKLAIKEYMPRDFATRNSTNAEIFTFAGDAKENFVYGLERFLDEARTLAKFQQHAGIVRVQNFFKANGTGYMVMEYVDGLTLKDYLADKGKLSWERTLELFMPVMDALREVHKHGLLHRDISPDNIYLCQDNRVKLLDFGSARYALGGHSRSLSVVVKPGYAPEEQYRAKGKQGAWTDVYSVAASMYRCVTGVVPPEALDRLDEDELVKPSGLGVQIPAGAERELMSALAIKAENRIQTIESFQKGLLGQVNAEPMEAIPVCIPKLGKAPPSEEDAYPWVQKDKFKKSEGYGKGLLSLLAFFVVAFFFFIQYFSKNTNQTESIPAPAIQTQSISKNTGQQASVDDGIKFYKQGNYDKALNIFRPAAEQGDAIAQDWLGFIES